MKLLLLSLFSAFVLQPAQGQYHYDRPQQAFNNIGNLTPPPQRPQQQQYRPPPTTAHFNVVGNSGKQYEVNLVRAQSVYEGFQPNRGVAVGNNYAPQSAPTGPRTTQHVNPLLPAAQHGAVQHGAAQFRQQQNVPQQGYVPPPPPPQPAYAPPTQQATRSPQAVYGPPQSQPAYATPIHQANRSPQAVHSPPPPQVAYGAPTQHATHPPQSAYGPPPSLPAYVQPPPQPAHFQHSQQQHQHTAQQLSGSINPSQQQGSNAYGQQSQYGGGVASGVQSGAAQLSTPIHNHVHYQSQSEAGRLDAYPQKLITSGDRPYERSVTVCSSNGQCEQSTLAPGQVDPKQLQISGEARGHVVSSPDKCHPNATPQFSSTAPQNQYNYAPSAQPAAPSNQYGVVGSNSVNYSPSAQSAPPSNEYGGFSEAGGIYPPSGQPESTYNQYSGAAGNGGGYAASGQPATPQNGYGVVGRYVEDYSARCGQAQQQAASIPQRPRDRRHFPYGELALDVDPYN